MIRDPPVPVLFLRASLRWMRMRRGLEFLRPAPGKLDASRVGQILNLD
jgi:hypothetical protein